VALDETAAVVGYPFDLPVVAGLRAAWLTLGPGVTFLVGENRAREVDARRGRGGGRRAQPRGWVTLLLVRHPVE
jgi:hypothetical protein